MSDIESETSEGPYRLTTKDGHTIVASKIEIRDSVIVLDDPPGTTFGTAGFPIHVPIDNVESIESYKSGRWSYLWLVGIAVVVWVFIALSVMFGGFATGT
jgi:hypothetical protein